MNSNFLSYYFTLFFILCFCSFFFFNDPATTEIYTLSLHDALPIRHLRLRIQHLHHPVDAASSRLKRRVRAGEGADRKSTRLNSSHQIISYAVFCLKKKNKVLTLVK